MVAGRSTGRIAVSSRAGGGSWARPERCSCCGAEVAPAEVVEGCLRGVVFVYCAQACLERHEAAVDGWGAACACGEDVLGDAVACGEHLDGDPGAELILRLAG
jgi:hypothetical protein